MKNTIIFTTAIAIFIFINFSQTDAVRKIFLFNLILVTTNIRNFIVINFFLLWAENDYDTN